MEGIMPEEKKDNRRGDFWRILQPICIEILITIVCSLAFSIAVVMKNMDAYSAAAGKGIDEMQAYVMKLLEENIPEMAYVTIIAGLICIPVMLFLLKKDNKIRKPELLMTPYGGAALYVPIALMAACTGIALNNLMLLGNLGEASKAFEEAEKSLFAIPFHLQLIGYGLVTPVSEEVIYRGLIYRRMKDAGFSLKKAGLMSAVLFAISHGNMVQGAYAFFLGILFAYMYEKKGSLKAPVICHMAVNCVTVLFTQKDLFVWMFRSFARGGLITVASAGCGAALLVYVAGKLPDKSAA